MSDRGFNVLGMNHVTITAPEELATEVLEWYEGCLGLQPVEKPEGTRASGGWLRAGDQELHVSIDEHNPPKAAHFALVVDDHQKVVERLRANKCHIEQASAIPGRHRFFTRDPAGNMVEIVSFDRPTEEHT